METKQTAVQFLIEHIKQDVFVHSKSTKEWNQVFAQAKQMEKEQIMNAFDSGYFNYQVLFHDNAEEYFNETYGKQDKQTN
jgi:hypothetical protein